jgi:ABC-type transport system involved in multi-copper enzyme maturation permease subunit
MSVSSAWAVVRAEWTKFRSLRSTVVTLALLVVVTVVLGVVDGASVGAAIDRHSPLVRPGFDPVNAGSVGVQYGQLALVAFAVLLVCGEYSSGTIRASLTAVPRRGLFYAGKLAAAASAAFLPAVIASFAGFLATQAALGRHGVSLGHGAALRATVGTVLYLLLICLFAMGLATLLRSSVLALSILFSVLLVVSPAANGIPALRPVARYLPDHAGTLVMKVGAEADSSLGPWAGLLVLAAWTAAAVAGGYVALRVRDV